MKLWQIFALWDGKEFDGSITYPNEFSIQSLNEDLDEAEKMMRLSLGKEFNKQVKEAIMRKKFPRMSDEDMGALIDAMAQKEDEAGQSLSGRLFDKIPSFKKPEAVNAELKAVKIEE